MTFVTFGFQLPLSEPAGKVALGAAVTPNPLSGEDTVRGYFLCYDQKDGSLSWVLMHPARVAPMSPLV